VNVNINQPTEKEVMNYFKSLNNWGRWGTDDELGTLNSQSPEKTKHASSLVKEGVTISCARPVLFEDGPDVVSPPVHFMMESGEGWSSGNKLSSRAVQGASDYFGMIFHGFTITHIDTPAHFFGMAECTMADHHI